MSALGRILILDFGSQTTQLIARRVREARVYCEIHPYTMSGDAIAAWNPAGVILSGGPCSVYADDAPMPAAKVFGLGVPILGICYGMQATVAHLGGRVTPGDQREFGRASITISEPIGPLAGRTAGDDEVVWMSHGDHVAELPDGFRVIAQSENGVAAVMAHASRPIFGVQFHPEVAHTPRGAEMLERFVLETCALKPDWTMASFVDATIQKLRAQIGDKRVLCGLSGGVDSAVVAALLHRAIGEQLTCVFVDNGLLRHREAEEVVQTFGVELNFNLVHIDAGAQFLAALEGVTDPEVKRKRIGHIFIEVFEKAAAELDGVKFLAQGTLYPDVIESVSVTGGPSVTIKSHHNVGGLPERLGFELVEPLRELFKDEVRDVGRELGLPERVVMRRPFPGPGLAVRVLGEVTPELVAVLQKADRITQEELLKHSWSGGIWQCFTVLLPVKSVGVMGDYRTYENVAVVRAVSSRDGMTADWYPVPHDVLGVISNRIINEVPGINRVAYDISSKPPATIEWE